jgi:hypothetical protein
VCKSHCGLGIYIIRKYLKAKKKTYENSTNISVCKNIIFKANPLKETKILQDIIITHVTNLKFQHKPKYHLSKNPHIKITRPIMIILPSRGQNPLSYYTL